MQFIKNYNEFEEAGLKPTEVSVLNHLYDRMNLSINHKQFYDKKYNANYVIYKRNDMANQINVDPSTISRAVKNLCKTGWIIVKKQFNGPNKFFLPHFILPQHHKGQNATSKIAKCNSSHTDYNQTDKISSNTYVTEKSAITNADKIKHLEYALKNKAGLSDALINTLIKYTGSKIYNHVGLIFKAKAWVLKHKYTKYQNKFKNSLRFESNRVLNHDLNNSLVDMLISANNPERKIKNKLGYIFSGLKKFFTMIVYNYLINHQLIKLDDTTARPRCNNKFSSKPKIKETLPEWAHDNYQPKYKKAPLEVRKLVQEKLRKLNAGE